MHDAGLLKVFNAWSQNTTARQHGRACGTCKMDAKSSFSSLATAVQWKESVQAGQADMRRIWDEQLCKRFNKNHIAKANKYDWYCMLSADAEKIMWRHHASTKLSTNLCLEDAPFLWGVKGKKIARYHTTDDSQKKLSNKQQKCSFFVWTFQQNHQKTVNAEPPVPFLFTNISNTSSFLRCWWRNIHKKWLHTSDTKSILTLAATRHTWNAAVASALLESMCSLVTLTTSITQTCVIAASIICAMTHLRNTS